MNTELDNLQNADGTENSATNQSEETTLHTVETEAITQQTEEINNEKITSDPKNNADQTKEVVSEQTHQLNDELLEIDITHLSMTGVITEMKQLSQSFPVQKLPKMFTALRTHFFNLYEEDKSQRKEQFVGEGNDETTFVYENEHKSKFNELYNEYKKHLSQYFKNQEKEQQNNLEIRLKLIDDLKGLYQNPSESNSHIFKSFREIRTQWHNTGMIPKAHASNVYQTYYHHLDNFYEYLNLNKELREMDLAHNLETRKSIINRANELLNETNIIKALNELQYLHRKWKEDAVPVADEFRDATWNEFKELTQKIHERRSELSETIRKEQEENLVKKEEIIAKIAEINANTENSHRFFQKNVKEVEELRENFFRLGRVPKEQSNKTWADFKHILKEFNKKKNSFYKDLKQSQSSNLEAKQNLVQIAKDNQESEDWETALQLYKKVQKDWRNIGHVPRKFSDALWNDFQQACNLFFDRYKDRNNAESAEWEANFDSKSQYINELKLEKLPDDKKQAFDIIKTWNAKWNELGKVPKDKIAINKEFQDIITQKLSEANFKASDMKSVQNEMTLENLKISGDERKLNDEIIKMKKQISDLNQEIVQLETNLGFFSNAKDDNPLLKNVKTEIERKKSALENLKSQLHKLHSIHLKEAKATSETKSEEA